MKNPIVAQSFEAHRISELLNDRQAAEFLGVVELTDAEEENITAGVRDIDDDESKCHHHYGR